MPGPFPGMDPWLEDEEFFPGLHERLAVYICDALNAAVPKGYVATIKNRVWVDDEQRREPDVALVGRDRGPGTPAAATATLPGMTTVGRERVREPAEEPYLEIVSPRGRRLVTAVEVVSPANKRAGPKGRKAYRDKQEEFGLAAVNLIEIDLLRRGPHVTAVPLAKLRRAVGPFDYHVSALVAGKPNWFHAAGIALADRLPAVGVPLDPGVPPVTVDLQSLLDRCYDAARYAEMVDYRAACDPPLTPEQQAWAAGVLREKGVLT